MDKILTDLTALVVPLAKSLVLAIIVFAVGFKLVNFLVRRMRNGRLLKNVDPSAAGFICSFTAISLKVIVIVSVVGILGVPMSSVIALVASAGVAVGLAVQGALSNLVGGIMILFFRPFRVGDYIETQSVGGTVREISVFYTVLVTPDKKIVTIPNGGLTNSVVTNYSESEDRRLDVVFTADYTHATDEVKKTMLDVAVANEKVFADPAPQALIDDCDERGVRYILRVWCRNTDYWDVRFALYEDIRNKFKDENIVIPSPRVDVRISND